MSYIITDKSKVGNSPYIELCPGKYDGSLRNDASIFFREDHWPFIERIIQRHYLGYNPYGPQSLNLSNWKPILDDLQDLVIRIENGHKVKDIREDISFLSVHDENEFLKNEEDNLIELKQTIGQLSHWVKDWLQHSQFVSILGL